MKSDINSNDNPITTHQRSKSLPPLASTVILKTKLAKETKANYASGNNIRLAGSLAQEGWLTSDRPNSAKTKTSLTHEVYNLGLTVVKNFAYSGLQSPVTGVAQIADKLLNTHLETATKVITSPNAQKFGTADWYAQQIGQGLGIGFDFLVANKAIGSLKSSLNIETAQSLTLAKSSIIGQSALSGAVLEGVFTPSNPNDNLLAARLKQAASGAATFAAMSSASIELNTLCHSLDLGNDLANKAINSNLLNGFLSGIPGGLTSANASSLLNGQGLASFKSDFQSVTAYSVAGLPLSLAHAFMPVKLDSLKPVTPDIISPKTDIAKFTTNDIAKAQTDITKFTTNDINFERQIIDSQGNVIFDPNKNFDTKIYDSNGNLKLDFQFSFPNMPQLDKVDLRYTNEIEDGINKLKTEKTAVSIKLTNGIKISPTISGDYAVTFPDNYKLLVMTPQKMELITPDGYKINHESYLAGQTITAPNGARMSLFQTFKQVKFSNSRILTQNETGEMTYTLPLSHVTDRNIYNLKLIPDYNPAIHGNNKLYFEAILDDNTKIVKFANGDYFARFPDGTTIHKTADTISTLSNNGIEYYKDKQGKITQIDRNLEYNNLISTITQKATVGDFTQTQLAEILAQFPDKTDKELANAFLTEALPNLSSSQIMKNFAKLTSNPDLTDSNFLYTHSLTSTGNLLAYLFRKATEVTSDILPVNNFDWTLHKGNIVLFDNLDKFTDSQIEKLKGQGQNIFIIDANNFDKTPNFIDLATGNIHQKLEALIKEAKIEHKTNPNLSPTELVSKVLTPHHSITDLEHTLNYIQTSKSNQSLVASVTPAAVDSYLHQTFSTFAYRLEAARILGNLTTYPDFKDLIQKSKILHDLINQDMINSDIVKQNLAKHQYIVGLDGKYGAHSSAITNYLYKVANNIPENSFISKEQYFFSSENEKLARQYIILDDATYSGSQLKSIYHDYFNHADNITFGLYAAYEDFIKRNQASSDPLKLITGQSNLGLTETAEFKLLGSLQKSIAQQPDGVIKDRLINQQNSTITRLDITNSKNAWGGVNSTQLLPYMIPDTTLEFVHNFAKNILGLKR